MIGPPLLTGASIALAGAGLGRALLPLLARVPRLQRQNFAGETVFAGGGMVIWLPAAAALAWEAWRGPREAAPAVTALLLFGLVGLVDDLWGDRSVGGFRGHLRMLFRQGRVTTGVIKLTVGAGAALVLGVWLAAEAAPMVLRVLLEPSTSPVLVPPLPELAPRPLPAWVGVLDLLTAAAVIALSANTLNLFDLRPLRALKALCVSSVLLLVAAVLVPSCARWLPVLSSRPDLAAALPAWLRTAVSLPPAPDSLTRIAALLGPALLAMLVYAPLEARRRVMLGDNGANALGALFGVTACVVLPLAGQAALALILAGINLYAESHSLSVLIRAHPLLDRLDRWGWGEHNG